MDRFLDPNAVDIRSIEIPLLPIEQQKELIRQLEDADELIRKAQEEREKKYFAAYRKIGIGDFIRKISEQEDQKG